MIAMQKIKARLLDLFSIKKCSVPGCDAHAVIQTGYQQQLCAVHLERIAIGHLAVAQERERRRQMKPDFLEQVEPDTILRAIEKAGFENYDPLLDQPRDAGKMMHQKKEK